MADYFIVSVNSEKQTVFQFNFQKNSIFLSITFASTHLAYLIILTKNKFA